jgi:putative ABC transport system permease protein
MTRRERRERDLRAELQSHLDLDAQARIAAGDDPAAARRRAERQFGNPVDVAEVTRAQWGGMLGQALHQDVRYGLRQLRRNPGFAAAAVLTLALGIGASVAIFSVVYATLLRPLPFRDAGRIDKLNETTPMVGLVSVSYPNFLDWQRQSRAFAAMSYVHHESFLLTGAGRPHYYGGMAVSSNFFATLGVRPALGRGFTPHEASTDVILSYPFFTRQFHGDAAALGRTLRLNGQDFDIVGVLPPSFRWPNQANVLVPLGYWIAHNHAAAADRGQRGDTAVFARLARGATIARARAELAGIAARLARAYPAADDQFGVAVTPLRDAFVGSRQPALLALLGGVIFLLLIACANVANLFLVRGAARSREIAVRRALGAGRGRIVRQLLTESLVLAALGGAAGLALALAGVRWLATLVPSSLGAGAGLRLNGPILLAALAVVLLAALLFGLGPALQAARPGVQSELKQEAAGLALARRRRGLRSLVAAGELALAVILLIGAGLMTQTLLRLMRTSPGFQPNHRYAMEIRLRPGYRTDAAVVNFWQQALRRIRAVPGVERAAVGDNVPFTDSHARTDITLEGMPLPRLGSFPHPDLHFVSPGYFATLGIPLLRGRDFNDRDNAHGPRVAVVNRLLARRYFGNADPVGCRLMFGHPSAAKPAWYTIVGEVGDTRMYGLGNPARLEVYLSAWYAPDSDMEVLVHSPVAAATLAPELRAAAASVDRDQPVFEVDSMASLIDQSVATPQTTFRLLALFSLAALVLAAIGVYGVIAFGVAQRTREIGIRMALGARAADVLRAVLAQGLALAGAGVLAGWAGAWLLTRFLANLLYQVRPADPRTFAAAAGVLALVALLAAYLPARRAARIDPLLALRSE